MLLNCGVGEDSWLRVPWTARGSNQFILKEISPGCSLEGLMLKLKFQYFDHLMPRVDSLEKTLMLGGIGGRRRRGQQRMRWLDGITGSMDMSLGKLGSWWWTGRPSVLRFMGSQRVGHDWATELNWTKLKQQYEPNSLVHKEFRDSLLCSSHHIIQISWFSSQPQNCANRNEATPSLFKVWSLDQQHQCHLKACHKCRIPSPIPDLLIRICILIRAASQESHMHMEIWRAQVTYTSRSIFSWGKRENPSSCIFLLPDWVNLGHEPLA